MIALHKLWSKTSITQFKLGGYTDAFAGLRNSRADICRWLEVSLQKHEPPNSLWGLKVFTDYSDNFRMKWNPSHWDSRALSLWLYSTCAQLLHAKCVLTYSGIANIIYIHLYIADTLLFVIHYADQRPIVCGIQMN